MDKYRALNEFVERVTNGEESFILKADHDASVHFISCKNGAARYFFHCRQYGISDFHNIDNKYELAAIYSGNKIYIIDWYAFGLYLFDIDEQEERFHEGVIDFDKFHRELNKYLFNEVYPKYYEAFQQTRDNAQGLTEENMLKDARTILFTGKDSSYGAKTIAGINRDDIANMLFRNTDKYTICLEVLDLQKQTIDYIKSRKIFIQRIIDSGKAAAEWEIALANAINATNAKTVIVEFELNGKTEEAKIECDRIIRNMIENDYFSNYDFQTYENGKKVLKELKASAYYYTPETNLYAKNIKSISFRGKKIYERYDG